MPSAHLISPSHFPIHDRLDRAENELAIFSEMLPGTHAPGVPDHHPHHLLHPRREPSLQRQQGSRCTFWNHLIIFGGQSFGNKRLHRINQQCSSIQGMSPSFCETMAIDRLLGVCEKRIFRFAPRWSRTVPVVRAALDYLRLYSKQSGRLFGPQLQGNKGMKGRHCAIGPVTAGGLRLFLSSSLIHAASDIIRSLRVTFEPLRPCAVC